MTNKLVLITGGAGFIGSHTADLLKEKGYRVRIMDNLARQVHGGKWPRYVQEKGFELQRGDVTKKKDWEEALQGVSYVFHLAAYQDQRPDFGEFFRVNTVGTALLYETAVAEKIKLKRVVLASSQFAYGDGAYRCKHQKEVFYPELRSEADLKKKRFDITCPHGGVAHFASFREDQQLTPINSYGLSKESLERLGMRLGKTYGVPTVALRYSIVQGARQSPRNLYSGALRIFTLQALRNEPITVYEDGNQLRDFVNVKDVAQANLLALTKKDSVFGIFNVGGGKGYCVSDFAQIVKNITGSSSRIVIGGYRRTDSRHAVSDIGKMKRLGWIPSATPEDSVREYVAWLRNEVAYRSLFLR
ncbi:MAG: NAD-dependent epimerase/dehydratase family protein [Patescibacteria group bacterium]|nr:NAD-dependent epimerase/dehydratase family protein [Patescibacteria group bacterium]